MDTIQFSETEFQAIQKIGLGEKMTKLLNLIEDLDSKNKRLENENIQLKTVIGKLKKQSSPPHFSQRRYSSKILKDKTKQRIWKKSIKKTKIEIDETIELPTVRKCMCGSVQFSNLRTGKKIIQEIRFKRNNICYIKKDKKCCDCGKIYKTNIPEQLKGYAFGRDLRTLISYLKFKCRMTQPLLHNLLSDLGISISTGEISNILLRNSKNLIPAYTYLRTWGIKNASYLQTDATGHKFKLPSSGKIVSQYMHFLGNSQLSLFKITSRYNAETINQLVTTRGKRKPFLSDDGGANGARLLLAKKQLCWIHEIRHYLKLNPLLPVHKDKVNTVITSLYQFYHAAVSYRNNPRKAVRHILEDEFDKLVQQKTGYEALDFRLQLTKNKRERLLLFLKYPFLPIHNNQSERDLRPAVIMRKISHETKSLQGNRSIERHLSIIHTAQKQHLNIFKTLDGLFTNTLSPFVLIASPNKYVPTQYR